MKKLSVYTALSLTFRTFFIRLFYNYINLFGEGLCFCLFPALKKDGRTHPEKHLKFFNTNEYLSGFAMGIILNIENNNKDDDTGKAKDILSSVMGSVGDRLIYKLILPVIVLTALNKFVISGFSIDRCTIIIVVSEVFLFNLFNFFIRYYGIVSGYEKGFDSIKIFRSAAYHRILIFMTIFRNILVLFLITNLILLNI
jgi:mannose/fructose/N-acetylgalactosamine-specific phosphotransferase system component IID